MASPNRHEQTLLALIREYQYLTPRRLALLRGTSLRAEQKNLANLFAAHKVHREPYFELDQQFGCATYVYYLIEDHSRRTLDHELDITDYHIKLQKYCSEHNLELIWQQKHMTGKFYPDAYFSVKGLHFFLEIERQKYGNVRNGQPSIIRKAESYYDYYNSAECIKRWGFNQFRVIFELKEINPEDFLGRLRKHRMYWVGTPASFEYSTPKADTFSFLDV